MECPESIEALQELEKLIPLCKVTLYNQAKARIETGAAKSVSEAARQLAEEMGRNPQTVRRYIQEEQVWEKSHLPEIADTDKFRPLVLTDIGKLMQRREFMNSDCNICEGTGYEDCFICRGSGEGMVDGTACNRCRGTGSQPCTCVLEPDDFEEDEERSRR